MQICGFVKTTLLDYPGHLASTVFLGGCNFKCPYCHNSKLLSIPSPESSYSRSEILIHLKKRQNILEGVCISGGEPTLQSELSEFLTDIKSLGYKIKLDTNGYHPLVIQNLLQDHLLDYIAMDIKNSKEQYAHTIGLPSIDITKIEQSVNLIMSSSISYEFRTTLVREFHHSDDIYSIGEWLAGANAYYLQNYKESEMVPDKSLHSFDKVSLLHFQEILEPFIPNTQIRGID
ncbi:ribonucleotide reductase of class III (anaerobic), activating protein [Lachnospiraceae bacterium KM106-2]|nr:ribonucleotide reductase of class III (anaerobic), activating protein [Lachnospiraceae bacterium KM106-2]